MGAVRIRCDFYSDIENVKYRVDIWDSDYAGSVITTIRDKGFILSYDSESDTILEPIKPSSVKFTLIDDGSGDFIAFESDLAQAQENEFKLIIYKFNAATPELYWAGVIMTDLVSWSNENTPREFEIIAKDGLNRAANIEFAKINSSPYIVAGVSAPQTIMKVIFDCLSYTETAQFWNGSGKPYIRVATAWQDTAQILDNTSSAKLVVRSLETIRLDRDFMFDREFDDKGQGWTKDEHWRWLNQWGNPHTRLRTADDPALKVRTILRELLQLLGLRIMLSEGIWWITQVSKLTDATIDYANYNYLGTFDTSFGTSGVSTVTMRVAPSVLSDGRFNYLPAIKSAAATVLPSDVLNIGDTTVGIVNNASTNLTKTFQLGTIYGGTGQYLKLELRWYPNKWKYVLAHFNLEIHIKLVIEDDTATTWRFKHTHTRSTVTQGEWTNTATDEIYIEANAFSPSPYYATVEFQTPEIPFTVAEGCTCEIEIDAVDYYGNALTASVQDFETLFYGFGIVLLNDDGVSTKITEYVSYNPDLTIGNSTDIMLGKLRIHDTGIIGGKNCIEVDEYVGAGRWAKSNVWDAGFDHDQSLVKTILKENVAFQRKPVKKYVGAFRGYPYNAYNVLTYDSSYWVFMAGTFSSKTSEWDGTWFKILRETTTIEQAATNSADDKGKVHDIGQFSGDYVPIGMVWRPPAGQEGNFPIPKAYFNNIYDTSGAVTTITVTSGTKGHMLSNDNLYVINPTTREVVETFVLNGPVSEGDTSISVFSNTPNEVLYHGYELCQDLNEVFASDEIRAANCTSIGFGNTYTKEYILKVDTSNATITELTTNGLAGSGTSNRIVVPAETVIGCEFYLTGKVSGSANSLYYKRSFCIANNGGTTALNGTVATVGTDIASVAIAAATTTISANNTNDAIKFEVTGIAATNIRWTAKVVLTYTTYA